MYKIYITVFGKNNLFGKNNGYSYLKTNKHSYTHAHTEIQVAQSLRREVSTESYEQYKQRFKFVIYQH